MLATRPSRLTDAFVDGPFGTPPLIERESRVVVALEKIEAAAVRAPAESGSVDMVGVVSTGSGAVPTGSGTLSARALAVAQAAIASAPASANRPLPRMADRPDNGMS
jgi:hypothetical protein